MPLACFVYHSWTAVRAGVCRLGPCPLPSVLPNYRREDAGRVVGHARPVRPALAGQDEITVDLEGHVVTLVEEDLVCRHPERLPLVEDQATEVEAVGLDPAALLDRLVEFLDPTTADEAVAGDLELAISPLVDEEELTANTRRHHRPEVRDIELLPDPLDLASNRSDSRAERTPCNLGPEA